eukprot:TRINITY_DN2903_c0_g1_i2.p1 TRINITY_DN2903_c0_g1~~TRINITY_DN2903_c0_g1_i2.p1  ORF type:complete len:547 (-),score=116.52 TRINITY_DN2903_c0_g1_i2:459-2099(-)
MSGISYGDRLNNDGHTNTTHTNTTLSHPIPPHSPLLCKKRTASIVTVWKGDKTSDYKERIRDFPSCDISDIRPRSLSDPFIHSWDFGSIELSHNSFQSRDTQDAPSDALLDSVSPSILAQSFTKQLRKMRRTMTIFDDEDIILGEIQATETKKRFPDIPTREQVFSRKDKNNTGSKRTGFQVKRPNSMRLIQNTKVYSDALELRGTSFAIGANKLYKSNSWVVPDSRRENKNILLSDSKPGHKSWRPPSRNSGDQRTKWMTVNTADSRKKKRKSIFHMSRKKSVDDRKVKFNFSPIINPAIEDEDDIVWEDYDGVKQLAAASVTALLCFLVDPDQTEQFIRVLLLTHEHFVETDHLLDFLDDYIKQIMDSPDVHNGHMAQVVCETVSVRLLKTWMDVLFSDFYEDEERKDRLFNIFKYFNPDIVYELQTYFDICENDHDSLIHKDHPCWEDAPKPVVGRKLRKKLKKSRNTSFEVTDFPVLELARQLTLVDHHLFSCVSPSEFFNNNFSDPAKSTNITNIAHLFEKRAMWISSEKENDIIFCTSCN